MVKRLKLVTSHQIGDPLRLQLGQAIEALAKAKADLVANETAEIRGRALVAAAETELERASANVAASRDQQADAYADAIAAARPLPASVVVQAAITTETEATYALEAARTGLARIRSDHDDRRAAIATAEETVSRKIAELMSPAIESLLKRGEQALVDLTATAAVLRYVSSPSDDPADRFSGGGFGRPIRIAAELHTRVTNLLNSRSVLLLQYNLGGDIEALVRRWKEVRAQLRLRADVPLPPLSPLPPLPTGSLEQLD
jgi:hypothetical protein